MTKTEASKSATEWMVQPVCTTQSTNPHGFTVYRVFDPYTDKARVEYLDGARMFKTEWQARAAIAAATGSAK